MSITNHVLDTTNTENHRTCYATVGISELSHAPKNSVWQVACLWCLHIDADPNPCVVVPAVGLLVRTWEALDFATSHIHDVGIQIDTLTSMLLVPVYQVLFQGRQTGMNPSLSYQCTMRCSKGHEPKRNRHSFLLFHI